MAIWRYKIWIIKAILVLCGLAVASLVFLQVIIRYFTSGSVFGIEEVALTFAVWFYFIGAALGASTGSHVSASLLEVMLPAGRTKRLMEALVALVTLVISIWVTVWALQYVQWVYERRMTSLDLNFPMVYLHASVALGMILMSLYFLRDLVRQLAACRSGDPLPFG